MHVLSRSIPLAVHRAALGAAIVLGSLAMWVGIPLLWIWVAGRLIDEYPSIYMLALAACPVTMAGWAWLLYRLQALYDAASRPQPDAPGTQRSAWLGSVSAERGPRRRQATLLDVSMIVSVVIALSAMAIWFFGFAHSFGPMPE